MGISSLIYDTWMKETQFRKYDGILEMLAKNSISLDGKTLDIGIGTGLFEDYLKGKGITLNVTGVDVDNRMLREAKKRGLNVMLADAKDLPFEDGEFDLVVSIDTINAIDDKEKAISEMERVMKKTGTGLITHFCNVYTKSHVQKKMEALTRRFKVIDSRVVGNTDNELSVAFLVRRQ